ncbi:Trm112 family protein [archaeon]|nr:Trm112 family protein [archaeon]
MSKGLLKILACPVCKGDLVLKSKKLVCKKCKEEYPIKDGVPILLPPELR